MTFRLVMLSCCLICLFFAYFLLPKEYRWVELRSEELCCTGLFPRLHFSMRYCDCQVTLDYDEFPDQRQGRKFIWWICIHQGSMPPYGARHYERISGIPIQPGFVRIQFSRQVYYALLAILPHDQRESLCAAWKRAANDERSINVYNWE